MSLRISENSIEEVKERADIVDIISEYVPLKHAGVNFKGCCPFHTEKTPSFIVSPGKQIFHCFGCGEGGNVFTFIMKYEKVSFIESIKILADKLGINLSLKEEKFTGAVLNDNKKKLCLKANQIAADFFHDVLINKEEGKPARVYLEKRKINMNMIKKFNLGFSPVNIAELTLQCKKENIPISILEELGLVNKDISIKDRHYSRFKNRLIFPIFDFSGRIAGFGGRILGVENNTAKYINSPESIIYNKRDILFGLNFAKSSASKAGNIILVEGYIDVIQVYQSGVEQVVASLGTALTQSQSRLIKRVTDTVLVMYDGDTAGIKAADRGLEILLENELYVKIIVLPSGLDPDNFIIQKGREAFLSYINKGQNLFNFKLYYAGKIHDKETIEGKIKIIEQLLPVIMHAPGTIQKQEYIKQTAEYLGLKEETIITELNERRKKESRKEHVDKRNKTPGVNMNIDIIEKEKRPAAESLLLQIVLKRPEIIREILSILAIDEIINEDIRKIFIFLKNNPDSNIENIIYNFQDESISRLVSASVLEPDTSIDNTEKIIEDCIKKIRETSRKKKLKFMLSDLKKAEFEKDERKKNQILKEINELKISQL